LLDEPGRGVDPEALRRIWDEIAALAAARATAVIVTTHQPEEAERCHRIAILDGGRVAATGTPDELRAHVAGRRRCACAAPTRTNCAPPSPRGCRSRAGSSTATSSSRRRGATSWCRASPSCSRPAGIAAIATSRPTLADVFAKLTGKGLSARDQNDRRSRRGGTCAASSGSRAASWARPRSR
jgi:ABC-2 type transport system ATP-binding protein